MNSFNFYINKKTNLLSEQQEMGFVEVDPYDELEGFKNIKTPNGKFTYVPDGTKILGYLGSSLKFTWTDANKGGKGNSQTDAWIPKDMSQIFKPDSVVSFQLPDGNIYQADFTYPEIEKIYSSNKSETEKWREFYTLTPNPNSIKFAGYTNVSSNSKYIPPKQPNTGFLGWIKRNWVILAQIAASIAVGILTAGSSLIVQAIAQLGVDIAFAIGQLTQGDGVGAMISVIIGLVPVIGRFAKFGTKLPMQFLKKYGKELAQINDAESLVKFYNKLPEGQGKELFSRVLKQTPGELKSLYNEGLKNVVNKAVKDDVIRLELIPIENRLWWKQMIVEPAVGITAGIGAGTFYAKKEAEREMEKVQGKIQNAAFQENAPKWTDEQINNFLSDTTTLDDD